MISRPARAERSCDVRRGIAEIDVVKRDGWRKRVRVIVSSEEDSELRLVDVERVVEGVGDEGDWTM